MLFLFGWKYFGIRCEQNINIQQKQVVNFLFARRFIHTKSNKNNRNRKMKEKKSFESFVCVCVFRVVLNQISSSANIFFLLFAFCSRNNKKWGEKERAKGKKSYSNVREQNRMSQRDKSNFLFPFLCCLVFFPAKTPDLWFEFKVSVQFSIIFCAFLFFFFLCSCIDFILGKYTLMLTFSLRLNVFHCCFLKKKKIHLVYFGKGCEDN